MLCCESVLIAQRFWQAKRDLCLRRDTRMGSVRESSDAMAAPKAATPVVEGVPVPAVAVPTEAVPGTPLLTAAPGTPMPATGPGTPGMVEATGPSPSQQAATTPPASPKDETLDVAAEPEPLVKWKGKARSSGSKRLKKLLLSWQGWFRPPWRG